MLEPFDVGPFGAKPGDTFIARGKELTVAIFMEHGQPTLRLFCLLALDKLYLTGKARDN